MPIDVTAKANAMALIAAAAVSPHPAMESGDVEFLLGNTLTPVPARHIVSFDELKEIAIHFLETGERSVIVSWEDV